METQAATIPVDNTLFWVGGGIVVFAAVIAIIFNRAVSTGHSLMIAIGAAIVLAPYVANFEWSENSIKVTTIATLTKTAQESAKGEVELRTQISQLAEGLKTATEGLKAATDRIAQLETKTGLPTQSGGVEAWPLEDFIEQNRWGKLNAERRFDDLQTLEQQLMPKL